MDETTGAGRESADFSSKDLVEPEGVNAASREVVDEHASGGGDVGSGGSPERAERQSSGGHARAEIVGTPGGRDDVPGQELSVGEG